jgi:hypothetical protein
MTRNRSAYFRAYRAARKLNTPLRPSRNRGHKGDDSLWRTGEFVAVDGEGITLPDGRHLYNLIAASDGASISSEPGSALSTEACFRFLLDRARLHPKGIFVCYGAGYDINCILRDVPYEVLQQIWASDKAVEFRLGDRLYSVLYRKGKMLQVGRFAQKPAPLYVRKGSAWKRNFDARVTLWDVLGFFQGPFVDALDAYFGECDDHRFIREMKAKRGNFAQVPPADIARYNEMENALLVRLMNELRRHLCDLGLTLSRFDGAGAIAAALFARNGTKSFKSTENLAAITEAARYAFSGGRIEMTHIGQAHAPVFDHDINSAYPHHISQLPCLAHGAWKRGRRAPFSLIRVRYEFPPNLPWYPLFSRTQHNSIAYGRTGEGWFWKPEFALGRAFQKIYGGTLTILTSYQWTPSCAHSPFAFVRDLYAERLKMKAQRSRTEHVLKLALNSLYGKFSQQLGGTLERPPPFFQLEWAGFVTASTRAQLGLAALRDPHAVLSFATDGLLARRPLDVRVGDGLGAWKVKKYSDALFVMPGVYFTKSGGEWSTRGRGFDIGPLGRARSRICRAWRRGAASVAVPSTRFVTLGSALSSDTLWERWATFRTINRDLTIDGTGSKRRSPRRYGRAGQTPADRLTFCPVSHLYTAYLDENDASYPYEVRWERNRADAPEDGTLDGVPIAIVEKELDASL